jgi:hypothetical protein
VNKMMDWLRGCVDEDQRIAQAGGEAMGFDQPGYPDYQTYGGPLTRAADAYLRQFSPARVLRQVATHRRILDEHAGDEPDEPSCCAVCYVTAPMEWPCPTVRAIVSIYADQLGYRPEWGEQ